MRVHRNQHCFKSSPWKVHPATELSLKCGAKAGLWWQLGRASSTPATRVCCHWGPRLSGYYLRESSNLVTPLFWKTSGESVRTTAHGRALPLVKEPVLPSFYPLQETEIERETDRQILIYTYTKKRDRYVHTQIYPKVTWTLCLYADNSKRQASPLFSGVLSAASSTLRRSRLRRAIAWDGVGTIMGPTYMGSEVSKLSANPIEPRRTSY